MAIEDGRRRQQDDGLVEGLQRQRAQSIVRTRFVLTRPLRTSFLTFLPNQPAGSSLGPGGGKPSASATSRSGDISGRSCRIRYRNGANSRSLPSQT